MSKQYILCVDDDMQVLSSLKQELSSRLQGEFSFEIAESGEEGLDILKELLEAEHEVPVVISDQLMPGMKGDEFLVKVNKISPNTRKILLTGQASANAVGNALNMADLYRFISKPWNTEDLLKTVKEAAKSYFMDQRLEAQVRLLTRINAYSTLMAEEMHLDKWFVSVLTRLMLDVDATRASFTINRAGENQPEVIFQAEKVKNEVEVKKLDFSVFTETYPIGIVADTLLNLNTVHLHNASATGDWVKDPVVSESKIKSIYCTPVLKKDVSLGALYLENRLKPRHFTDERAELLKAVATQSGLALDNLMLYHDMERRVSQQTQGIREDHSNMKDSINYASRIQKAIMPDLETLQERLPDSFVYYKPKDIVSGDFYWHTELGDQVFIAAADCTGHGVPGAFLSMMGVNMLNQIVIQKGTKDTQQVLLQLHKSIQNLLKQEDENSPILDGMDICLIALDLKAKTIDYSAANRPLILFQKGELQRLAPTKHPIGGKASLLGENSNEAELFQKQTVKFTTGDSVFLFTDGITDQFAADNKKKFSLKRFEELLNMSQMLPMRHQMNVIENRLQVWQGTNTQTDDLLVIGIKL
jgi:serine phosphatase RsbU (regulator of sigma subunit)/DNA-binding NarL/FixJ family response regulator